MACLFIDGFDKYGPPNTNNTYGTQVSNLTAGEWTSGSGCNIVAGLSATGYAISMSATILTKVFPTNSARYIGGVRYNTNVIAGITFTDGGSNQSSIEFNSTGTISVRNGTYNSGTILGTSTAVFPLGTTHYIEWDFTFTSTGAYQVWVDGTSILSGTGNLVTTAHNYANGLYFSASGSSIILDDLYLFDNTGATNNAVLLTSPRVETTFPVSDSSVQFAIGASIIGTSVPRSGSLYNVGANTMSLRPVTASRAMTLNTLYSMANITNATINFRMVIYADSSGIPGALLGQSNPIVGCVAATPFSGNLLSPVTLTAGVQYWIGYMQDTTLSSLSIVDNTSNLGRWVSVTFSGGPPSTAPAMTGGQFTMLVWGAVTLTAPVNFYEVNQQPAPGQYSYVYSSTVGNEDLYNFNALSVIPTAIYAVSVKSWAAKSDTGARTMSMRTLSSGVDSGGTVTGQALGTTFQWYGTMFETDPGTSAAWTGTGLNAAQSGFRVDS